MPHSSPGLTRARAWLAQTPLAVCAEDLLTRFREDGYAEATTTSYLRVIAHFGQWLEARHLSPSDFSAQLVTSFLQDHLPDRQCRPRINRDAKTVGAALRRLGEVLRDWPLTSTVPHSPQSIWAC